MCFVVEMDEPQDLEMASKRHKKQKEAIIEVIIDKEEIVELEAYEGTQG
jgi:hypothetical protein